MKNFISNNINKTQRSVAVKIKGMPDFCVINCIANLIHSIIKKKKKMKKMNKENTNENQI